LPPLPELLLLELLPAPELLLPAPELLLTPLELPPLLDTPLSLPTSQTWPPAATHGVVQMPPTHASLQQSANDEHVAPSGPH
jgi:hypothetical protein